MEKIFFFWRRINLVFLSFCQEASFRKIPYMKNFKIQEVLFDINFWFIEFWNSLTFLYEKGIQNRLLQGERGKCGYVYTLWPEMDLFLIPFPLSLYIILSKSNQTSWRESERIRNWLVLVLLSTYESWCESEIDHCVIVIIIIRHQFIVLILHSVLFGGCREKKLAPRIGIVSLTWLLIDPDQLIMGS